MNRLFLMIVNCFLALHFLSPQAEAGPKFKDSAMSVRATETRLPRSLTPEEVAERKLAERRACRQSEDQSSGYGLYYSNKSDDIKVFMENAPYVSSVLEMDAKSLQTGRVDRQPWSGDYWAIARGVLGARPFDNDFMDQYSWLDRFNFVKKKPASDVIQKEGVSGVAKLSPSEKYDLVIGDSAGAMTEAMWQQGKEYHDRDGRVESWMGICHGWAPAAIAEPRPARAISLKSFDEKWDISLTPAEIKGLVSYSWATNRYSAITLGSRCNLKDPPKDENGRALDPECNDMNAGTWHIVLVNKLGMKKQSFVIDATYDYEVWNQPVLEYQVSYFNPITKVAGATAEEVMIRARDWDKDPYAKHRTRGVHSIVGVNLKLAYVLESSVTDVAEDNPEQDIIRWVKYQYDLELNAAGEIIGGEWHSETHPDFVWIPRTGIKPQSPLDHLLKNTDWDGSARVPDLWSAVAMRAAPYGVILNPLTDAILKKSAISE